MESLITCVIWGYDTPMTEIELKWENNHYLWKWWTDSL